MNKRRLKQMSAHPPTTHLKLAFRLKGGRMVNELTREPAGALWALASDAFFASSVHYGGQSLIRWWGE